MKGESGFVDCRVCVTLLSETSFPWFSGIVCVFVGGEAEPNA